MQEEIDIGTGLERAARYRQPAAGGRNGIICDQVPDCTAMGGNAANAAVAASAAAANMSCIFINPWIHGLIMYLSSSLNVVKRL